MAVKVIFYPPYSDWLGHKSAIVELPANGIALHAFENLLLNKYPQLKKKSASPDPGDILPALLVMIESKTLQKNDIIKNGDEIKILYPLCGG